jgi:hypothetical protein
MTELVASNTVPPSAFSAFGLDGRAYRVRSRTASTKMARNSADLSWRLNRHDSRPPGRGGNMMRLILTILLSRANSSGGGMQPSRP